MYKNTMVVVFPIIDTIRLKFYFVHLYVNLKSIYILLRILFRHWSKEI